MCLAWQSPDGSAVKTPVGTMEASGSIIVVYHLVGLFLTLGQSKPPDEIRASKFIVVDEDGKASGFLGMAGDESVVSLMDKDAFQRTVLSSGALRLSRLQGPTREERLREQFGDPELQLFSDRIVLSGKKYGGILLNMTLADGPQILIVGKKGDSGRKTLFKAPRP